VVPRVYDDGNGGCGSKKERRQRQFGDDWEADPIVRKFESTDQR
jgi:hypothetical protein